MKRFNTTTFLYFALGCLLLFVAHLRSQQPPTDAELKTISLQGQLATCQAEAQLTIRKLQKEIAELKAAAGSK